MSILEEKAQQIHTDLTQQKTAFPLMIFAVIGAVVGIIALIAFLKNRPKQALACLRKPNLIQRVRMKAILRNKLPEVNPTVALESFMRSAESWSTSDMECLFKECM